VKEGDHRRADDRLAAAQLVVDADERVHWRILRILDAGRAVDLLRLVSANAPPVRLQSLRPPGL
jgi:hypothetical protein